MYVLSYYALGETYLCVGHGQGAHVVALFVTDSLWLVPGTVDPREIEPC